MAGKYCGMMRSAETDAVKEDSGVVFSRNGVLK